MTDQRRKLQDLDYSRIRFYINSQNCTIREVANTFGISTKYVKRILGFEATPEIVETTPCSGCGYSFDSSGLLAHYYTWTSGGMRDLACMVVVPK